MNTSFLGDVEELITWIFDHEDDFIEKFCKSDGVQWLSSLDNVFVSSQYVYVRDTYIGGSGHTLYADINEVTDWIGDHEDGY